MCYILFFYFSIICFFLNNIHFQALDLKSVNITKSSRKLKNHHIHDEDYIQPVANYSDKCLFILSIRFVGEVVLKSEPNSAAAIRCEIFQRVTLPSILLSIKNKPTNYKVIVQIINESSILEPTCKKVIDYAKFQLGSCLMFTKRKNVFKLNISQHSSYNYLFFSRLDTDDAFTPFTLQSISNTFISSGLPFAILSPLFITLWYITSSPESAPCGEMIYNSIFRNFQILQSTAIDKRQLLPLLKGSLDKLSTTKASIKEYKIIEWLKTKGVMPYNFGHEEPIEATKKIESIIPACHNPQDCLLYINSWVNGVSGFLYTQTGLQNSYKATNNPTENLKFYDQNLVKPKKQFPKFCDYINNFDINEKTVKDLRYLINKFSNSSSSSLSTIQTMKQASIDNKNK